MGVIPKGPIWLALHKQFPSSPETLRRIGEVCDGHVERLRSLSESRSVESFGETAAKKLSSLAAVLKDVKQEWEGLKKQGVKLVPFTDKGYPDNLKRLAKSPPILYMLGNTSLLKLPSVGICGSRDSSDAGLRNALKFGTAAGRLGLVVVSGYARGVDTKAHLGAINSSGHTIMVLAEGIDRFRKKRQFKDVSDFSARTLVVSQFYPKQTWRASAAMERNSVICGLSNAMGVIEAGPTGGTVAAGRECLTQGKPLWVLDYAGLPHTASGNRTLIGEGGLGLHRGRDWLYALYNVLTDSRHGSKTRRPKQVYAHAGVDLETIQFPLSIDSLEEQVELFDSTARI